MIPLPPCPHCGGRGLRRVPGTTPVEEVIARKGIEVHLSTAFEVPCNVCYGTGVKADRYRLEQKEGGFYFIPEVKP